MTFYNKLTDTEDRDYYTDFRNSFYTDPLTRKDPYYLPKMYSKFIDRDGFVVEVHEMCPQTISEPTEMCTRAISEPTPTPTSTTIPETPVNELSQINTVTFIISDKWKAGIISLSAVEWREIYGVNKAGYGIDRLIAKEKIDKNAHKDIYEYMGCPITTDWVYIDEKYVDNAIHPDYLHKYGGKLVYWFYNKPVSSYLFIECNDSYEKENCIPIKELMQIRQNDYIVSFLKEYPLVSTKLATVDNKNKLWRLKYVGFIKCYILLRTAIDPPVVQTKPKETIKKQTLNETEKQKLKKQEKKKINKKFIIGDTYILRSKRVKGCKQTVKEFIIKKYIYTINDEPVNVVIVKQISGDMSNIFTLNRNDCKKLHLKFEEGLQVYPMELNWIRKRIRS